MGAECILYSLFNYLMTFLTAATEAASRTSRKAKEFCLTSPRMTEVSWSVSPGLSPCRPTLLPSWSPDVSTVARSCTTALQNKHRTMEVAKWCLGPPYIWNRNSSAPWTTLYRDQPVNLFWDVGLKVTQEHLPNDWLNFTQLRGEVSKRYNAGQIDR